MVQTEAILIRKQAWSDSSLIVTWFTADHGKVRAVARAARRSGSALAGKIDLFYKAEIAFTMSRRTPLCNLREVHLLEPFDASLVPYANIFLGGYFAEVLDLGIEPGHPAPEIYDLLVRAVEHLRTQTATTRSLEHFEREFCRLLGVGNQHPLQAIETYCTRIPESRATAIRLLSGR